MGSQALFNFLSLSWEGHRRFQLNRGSPHVHIPVWQLLQQMLLQ